VSSLSKLFDVAGKTAIVTGGSQGIGIMIARGLVENGVKTYITSRTQEECRATAEALSEYGKCVAIACDLSTSEGKKELVQTFSTREDKLDILINNTGIVEGGPLESFAESEWDKVMNINLKSLFFLTQQLLNKLKQAASADTPARVINIASVFGIQAPAADSLYAYATSKAGVIHLTQHLATRLAPDHITVNAISPALFPNRRTAGSLEADASPLGRIGTADDIAGVAIFLSSRAGSWVTGVNIPVDGGFLLKS